MIDALFASSSDGYSIDLGYYAQVGPVDVVKPEDMV